MRFLNSYSYRLPDYILIISEKELVLQVYTGTYIKSKKFSLAILKYCNARKFRLELLYNKKFSDFEHIRDSFYLGHTAYIIQIVTIFKSEFFKINFGQTFYSISKNDWRHFYTYITMWGSGPFGHFSGHQA